LSAAAAAVRGVGGLHLKLRFGALGLHQFEHAAAVVKLEPRDGRAALQIGQCLDPSGLRQLGLALESCRA